jgi:glucose/mannose transport system substrate-binding protein
LQWVFYNGINVSENKLEPIDDLAMREDWATQFPTPVLNTVRVGTTTYGVPLNVHRLNMLFYNRRLFAEAGLQEPTTLDELFVVAAALEARGVVPFALGSKDIWTLSLLFFENLMVARHGGAFYRDFFRGDVDYLGEQVMAVVADFDRLLSYTNRDPHLVPWTKAADLVRDGEAAMTIMGDWTKGYFVSKALVPDQDFGAIPMPGTAGTFVFTTDTFGLPKGSPDKKTALELLEVFGSQEGQKAFNPIKGSISPRMDVDSSVYTDAMAQRAITDFRTAAMSPATLLVPATAILAPPTYNNEIIQPALAAYAANRNVSVLLHTFNNYRDVLRNNPLRLQFE